MAGSLLVDFILMNGVGLACWGRIGNPANAEPDKERGETVNPSDTPLESLVPQKPKRNTYENDYIIFCGLV